jgi:hypothetical protein
MLNETNPEGMFISSDGLKLYTVGTTLDTVYRYNLSQAWNISSAVAAGQSFNFSSRDATPVSVFFNGSGTRMYVLGITNDIVMQYNLSIAWNVTSAVYANNVSVSAVETSGSGIWFSPNGSIMYLTDNSDRTTQWSLSTPWLVSTATYAGKNISNPESTITDMYLDSTGTILHLVGTTNDRIYQYVLSTPFDITTAVSTSILGVGGVITAQPNSIFFNGSGKTLYVYESDNDSIRQFNLPNAYDFSDPLWSNGFCWSAWFNADSLGETAGRIVDKTDGPAAVGGVAIAIQSNNQSAVFYNGETTALTTVGSTPLSFWKNIVVSANSSGYFKVYVDGELNNESQSAYNMSKFTSLQPLTIGNRGGGSDRTFDGRIDQVRVYSSICNDVDAWNLYLEGNSTPHIATYAIIYVNKSVNDLQPNWSKATIVRNLSNGNMNITLNQTNVSYGIPYLFNITNSNNHTVSLYMNITPYNTSILVWKCNGNEVTNISRNIINVSNNTQTLMNCTGDINISMIYNNWTLNTTASKYNWTFNYSTTSYYS